MLPSPAIETPDHRLICQDPAQMAELATWACDVALWEAARVGGMRHCVQQLTRARAIVNGEADVTVRWAEPRDSWNWMSRLAPGVEPDEKAITASLAEQALRACRHWWSLTLHQAAGQWTETIWDPKSQMHTSKKAFVLPVGRFCGALITYYGHSVAECEDMTRMVLWGTTDPEVIEIGKAIWPTFGGTVAEFRDALPRLV